MNNGKVDKAEHPPKYQNLDSCKLLEKIDEDIQRLNRLKVKLEETARRGGNGAGGNEAGGKGTVKEEEEKVVMDHYKRKPPTVKEATNQEPEEAGQETTPVDITVDDVDTDDEPDWRDNSHSILMKGVDPAQFRRYELAYDRVKDFYREQHSKQTVAYNIQARINFKTKVRDRMHVWDALVKLNKLLDESDPDTELSQIDHALQTAEAIRRDHKPRWFQCVGLIHDLGKLLYFYDSQGQWDVVGDTFPVGCRFSKKIIYHDYFKGNPDSKNPLYNTKYGIYSRHCGLDNVMLSWGHDEYMYNLAREQSTLPPEGLYMIRYHSFYPWHREGAYKYLMKPEDAEMLKVVQTFNPYDLYSKSEVRYRVEELKPYYLDLIDEFFPSVVEF
ncbi:DEKNAAC104239 [Brettanomyces naardenensis]|uniref:Inositol oxygenase n=1 Tax=Brettanomyces naardenensis TaxID=13370 RepID=A0A448YQ08_BRENA|nr:DEKNAAC104239 [Brettanomyces naardenensis]